MKTLKIIGKISIIIVGILWLSVLLAMAYEPCMFEDWQLMVGLWSIIVFVMGMLFILAWLDLRK